jgi:hypothetical protein
LDRIETLLHSGPPKACRVYDQAMLLFVTAATIYPLLSPIFVSLSGPCRLGPDQFDPPRHRCRGGRRVSRQRGASALVDCCCCVSPFVSRSQVCFLVPLPYAKSTVTAFSASCLLWVDHGRPGGQGMDGTGRIGESGSQGMRMGLGDIMVGNPERLHGRLPCSFAMSPDA